MYIDRRTSRLAELLFCIEVECNRRVIYWHALKNEKKALLQVRSENPYHQHLHNLDKSYTMRHLVCSLQWVTTHTRPIIERERDRHTETARESERVTSASLSSFHQPPALPWPQHSDMTRIVILWQMLIHVALHGTPLQCICLELHCPSTMV